MQNEWTREIERLKDERDGYRNGQQQMQDMNAKLIDANNALKRRLAPIEAVYEQFKHLDMLLSDKDWLDTSSPQRHCLYDLWAAIKEVSHE